MTLPAKLWEQVRQRADFACEYCGITETSAGGLLTVDHFQPQAHGGADDLANLIYCCHRCNLYKADYWPIQPADPRLWNPREEAAETHLLLLANGMLHSITATGTFTLRQLRLNRPALAANRLIRLWGAEQQELLRRYQQIAALLEQTQRQQAALLQEHHALLEKQRVVLRLLLRIRE
jgi:HNH endonuclease